MSRLRNWAAHVTVPSSSRATSCRTRSLELKRILYQELHASCTHVATCLRFLHDRDDITPTQARCHLNRPTLLTRGLTAEQGLVDRCNLSATDLVHVHGSQCHQRNSRVVHMLASVHVITMSLRHRSDSWLRSFEADISKAHVSADIVESCSGKHPSTAWDVTTSLGRSNRCRQLRASYATVNHVCANGLSACE